jgi:hypothetical protein
MAIPMTTLPIRRAIFVLTILTGSFLLFMVQPMIARMALPQLGGAPNVWNSAMLVFQALLLGGYLYAHLLGRLSLRNQAKVHLGLLLLAGLTLPLSLAKLAPATPGSEAFWVPLLFLASVGPVFFLMSAQAPLMQRWFSAHDGAGEPWALYAASNLGSFAGLLAFPLLAEPLLPVRSQSLLWSVGYGLLLLLTGFAAWSRWQVPPAQQVPIQSNGERVGSKRILLWLALAAVPSGLMLSTTTHLTTDIFALPLLWVLPLGLYLLSFVVAFSDRRRLAGALISTAPLILVLAGSFAMASHGSGTLMIALSSLVLLFVLAVALHGRLYDLRPGTDQLTLFYVVMSAGGALGGLFTALVAPLLFDWVWEHPLLILAAAFLIPAPTLFNWRDLLDLDPFMARLAGVVLVMAAVLLAFLLMDNASQEGRSMGAGLLVLGLALVGLLLTPWRWAFASVALMTMLAQGGLGTIKTSLAGARSRSYFGVYTVREQPVEKLRTLAHGTTLHGQQSTDPARALQPMSYYGPTSGAALALDQAPALFGTAARVGVVGLGTGTLACFTRPGQQWRIFEIDPAVVRYSQDRTFTFIANCAPNAEIVIGDARLKLAQMPKSSLDMLVVDAFSSDAIPLHLLTDEAMGVYFDALTPRGLLVLHISNRFIELEPVIAALAKHRGLTVIKRDDNPYDRSTLTPSTWLALSRDPAIVATLGKARADAPWAALMPPSAQVWSDDHASILPFVRWENILKAP